MKLMEIRNLSESDISGRQLFLRKELFDMRHQKTVGKMDKPARFKIVKKEIARILTIINERKIQNGKKS